MKVLVIFSNPPGQTPLRLDREDKILAQLAREHSQTVFIERQHASELDDVHALIADGGFDVIQFSGHGSPNGIYLDKNDLSKGQQGELVSARRLLGLLGLADKPPLLVLFLCCYSHTAIDKLADAAPFVITADHAVGDQECIVFVRGFYERLLNGYSVQSSFEHASHLLTAKDLASDQFRLSRRQLIHRGNSVLISSTPDPNRDSILVNLDAVADHLDAYGMPIEQLYHLLARKITIHHWIFNGSRERALVPVGRMLFGEFEWTNAKDVVYCKRLMKLRSDVPARHWEIWSRLLTSYNDLKASEHRDPKSPGHHTVLEQAVTLFTHHIRMYLEPARPAIEELGCTTILPNLQFAITECKNAADQLALGRYDRVVQALERSLTNYHEVVDGVQPPEEILS